MLILLPFINNESCQVVLIKKKTTVQQIRIFHTLHTKIIRKTFL